MRPMWVAMRWKDHRWIPLCGAVSHEAASEYLDDKHIIKLFQASSDATYHATIGGKDNENG